MPERTTDAVPIDDTSAGDHQLAAGTPPYEAAAVRENPSSEPPAGTHSKGSPNSANDAANRPLAMRGGPRIWLLVIALIGGCGFFFLQRGGGGQGGQAGKQPGRRQARGGRSGAAGSNRHRQRGKRGYRSLCQRARLRDPGLYGYDAQPG
jgi:hypothetical protein